MNKEKTLEVRISGTPAGRLRQLPSGQCEFGYYADYEGVPLSLSMPVSNRIYGDKTVAPYLLGLLPEDPSARKSAAREFGVSANNPFALLSHMGLDCPGAVQFVSAEAGAEPSAPASYAPMSDEEIGIRLRKASLPGQASWKSIREHWSLGGQQAKIALARIGGSWRSCEGSAATTHILKPGITDLKHQALNEFVCMRLAATCGIPAAKVEYAVFDGEAAVVVERFDRLLNGAEVTRIHQEDLCQALGVRPDNKYASEGGPSVRDVTALLSKTNRPQQNKIAFTTQLFFNYLVGAPDAHAKNYSVILDPKEGALLSPLYDVASGLAYEPPRGGWRLAMGIGGENRMGRVRANEIKRHAEICGLDEELCLNVMGNLAESILEHAGKTFSEILKLPEGRDLASRLQPAIEAQCGQMLTQLE